MYESYWQMATKPFENNSDMRFYYPAETHQGALLKLRYAVENRRGAALLCGSAGLGKSLIVRALLQQLDAVYSPHVHMVFPQMPADQLLGYLAESLANDGPVDQVPSIGHSVRVIEQVLEENVAAGKHAVVVIDEAQDLDDADTLETVRLLLNFEFQGQSPLTVLLVGQPSLLPVLDRTAELDERLAVKCLLRCLSLEETISYVHHRLQAAGARQEIFQPDALEAVHYLAHGVPRRINRLCDLALLIGFAEERESIDQEKIEAIAEELMAVVPE
jgi:type II secretory pathway predicted ATPase ExeA